MTTLTDEQKTIVTAWVRDGASLGEVQKRLQEEFSVSLTYLDARLLVAELNVVPPEPPKEPEAEKPADQTDLNDLDEHALGGDELLPPESASKVRVTIDELVRPNAMISGKVTFSDGERAEWQIDTAGRLGLTATNPAYRPSQEDVMAFQVELQNLAKSQGL